MHAHAHVTCRVVNGAGGEFVCGRPITHVVVCDCDEAVGACAEHAIADCRTARVLPLS